MSNAIIFNSIRFVEDLTSNGFTKQQAEVLAKKQINLLNSNLVTKEHLDKRLAETQVELTKALAETKAETIK